MVDSLARLQLVGHKVTISCRAHCTCNVYIETIVSIALKYIEKVVNSYNEVHTYSIVITLHACGLWNMYCSLQNSCHPQISVIGVGSQVFWF